VTANEKTRDEHLFSHAWMLSFSFAFPWVRRQYMSLMLSFELTG
jgi:hypothetical protein